MGFDGAFMRRKEKLAMMARVKRGDRIPRGSGGVSEAGPVDGG
jgi:hypothetical protein